MTVMTRTCHHCGADRSGMSGAFCSACHFPLEEPTEGVKQIAPQTQLISPPARQPPEASLRWVDTVPESLGEFIAAFKDETAGVPLTIGLVLGSLGILLLAAQLLFDMHEF